jgi:hypothetical protein
MAVFLELIVPIIQRAQQLLKETRLDGLEPRSLAMIFHGSASYSLEEKMHAAGLEQMARFLWTPQI